MSGQKLWPTLLMLLIETSLFQKIERNKYQKTAKIYKGNKMRENKTGLKKFVKEKKWFNK